MSVRTIRLSPDWPEVDVIYEDDSLWVIDKPAGLLVAPDRWDKERENLMGLLQAGIKSGKGWAKEAGIDYLANVHRLDADTSGLLLLARNREALTALSKQFEKGHPQKIYIAVLGGVPAEDRLEIDLPIGEHPFRPGLSAIDKLRGKSARSLLRVVERFDRHALAEVEILTGRHHQIRVHAQAVGHPLVGDQVYGGKPLLLSLLKPRYKMKEEGERPLIGRPALHAWRLTVKHPVKGVDVAVEAPLPKDLTVGLKYLRRYGKRRTGA